MISLQARNLAPPIRRPAKAYAPAAKSASNSVENFKSNMGRTVPCGRAPLPRHGTQSQDQRYAVIYKHPDDAPAVQRPNRNRFHCFSPQPQCISRHHRYPDYQCHHNSFLAPATIYLISYTACISRKRSARNPPRPTPPRRPCLRRIRHRSR